MLTVWAGRKCPVLTIEQILDKRVIPGLVVLFTQLIKFVFGCTRLIIFLLNIGLSCDLIEVFVELVNYVRHELL